jgi:hypothetical protein
MKMTLDLINSTPEETRQQLYDLLLCADHGQAVSEIAIEVERLSKFAKQGYSKWKGSKKGRRNNLKLAILASIEFLQKNRSPLDNKSIIKSLRVVNAGLNEFQTIIEQIEDEGKVVYWVDHHGVDQETDFVNINQRIKVLNQSLKFR